MISSLTPKEDPRNSCPKNIAGHTHWVNVFSENGFSPSYENKKSKEYKKLMQEVRTHNFEDTIKVTIVKLMNYCKKNKWAGYDPYDALNCEILRGLPFLDFRLFRLGFTQLMKKIPVNLRHLLLIPKTQNPKGLALFLIAFIKIQRIGLVGSDEIIKEITEKLIALRSKKTKYWCWGYNFPWQTRRIIVHRWAPNVVCTSFVADALIDLYESNHENRYLDMARSAAEYMLDELYWTEGNSIASFSYPLPSVRIPVHNANFLGAAVLTRIYRYVGEDKYLEAALKVAQYSVAKQHEDGSWDYGESYTQSWADNFHTGYNLCALQTICKNAVTSEFESQIKRGFDYYKKHFFTKDGVAKYFHNKIYPIDIHSIAQSIITLLAFKELDNSAVNIANAVFRHAITNMWDEQGYFYYQAHRYYRNRISYMRWSQAWMLLALSTLLEGCNQNDI